MTADEEDWHIEFRKVALGQVRLLSVDEIHRERRAIEIQIFELEAREESGFLIDEIDLSKLEIEYEVLDEFSIRVKCAEGWAETVQLEVAPIANDLSFTDFLKSHDVRSMFQDHEERLLWLRTNFPQLLKRARRLGYALDAEPILRERFRRELERTNSGQL